MNRITTITAALAAVAAIAPASGMASTPVGADVDSTGASEAPNCGAFCTLVHPNKAFGMVSPSSGVITKWRIRNAGPFNATGALRVVETDDQPSETTTGIATGKTQVLSQKDNTFATQLPIKAGQSIAVDVGGNPKVISGDNFLGAVERYLGGVGDGETHTNGNNIVDASGQIALAATVEADADGDGLGDESQDPCKGDQANACAAAQGNGGQNGQGGNGADRTAPKASASFGKRFKLRKGVKGKVTSNEAGSVQAQLERKVKRGKKTRTSIVKTTTVKLGKPGTVALKLRPGRRSTGKLTLRITVRDQAGNATVITKRVTVKR